MAKSMLGKTYGNYGKTIVLHFIPFFFIHDHSICHIPLHSCACIYLPMTTTANDVTVANVKLTSTKALIELRVRVVCSGLQAPVA